MEQPRFRQEERSVNLPATVDMIARRQQFDALATRIVKRHAKSQGPGLEPIAVETKFRLPTEIKRLGELLAEKAQLGAFIAMHSAQAFEELVRRGADPGVAIVISDGENLSKAVQARLVAQGRPGSIPFPPMLVVVTPQDPGKLVEDGRWTLTFRRVFSHWRWPSIKVRRMERPRHFVHGVELAAIKSGRPLPEIDDTATRMVRSLPIADTDEALALIYLGGRAFKAMSASRETRIESKHVLVSLPGTSSPPPAQGNQQQASAG